ncbi:MAG: hypothetical protein IPG96_05960 [Proteobacteria bacterium]|nr:hypothetical protein [Pseudomonadota bacterium]
MAVSGLTQVAQVALGAEHTCARRTDGTVYCWGNRGGPARRWNSTASAWHLSRSAA